MQARTQIARHAARVERSRLKAIQPVWRSYHGGPCPLTIRWLASRIGRDETYVSDVLRARRTSMPVVVEVRRVLDACWDRLCDLIQDRRPLPPRNEGVDRRCRVNAQREAYHRRRRARGALGVGGCGAVVYRRLVLIDTVL